MNDGYDVEVGDVVTAEETTVLGTTHTWRLRVDRMDADGVYEDTLVGERFVPWEAFDQAGWSKQE